MCSIVGFKQKQRGRKVLFFSFLSHTTAKDLYDGFTTVLNYDILAKLLQVSMDGPSLNLTFFDPLDDFQEKFENMLLEMGSCGLALQNDHKNAVWYLNFILRSFYEIFHDSSDTRAYDLSITKCDKSPI